jgi:hypothetical protein
MLNYLATFVAAVVVQGPVPSYPNCTSGGVRQAMYDVAMVVRPLLLNPSVRANLEHHNLLVHRDEGGDGLISESGVQAAASVSEDASQPHPLANLPRY